MQSSWIATGGLLAAALWAAHGGSAKPLPAEVAAPNPPGASAEGQDDVDGKALFLTNCARCHGETGDGKGITELDRPARSFKDGGFSYGNTVGAIVRTITNGIPGTPMPAFDASSTEAQRKAMAEYVISLGPPGVVVDPAATVLVVEDRPLVVRGFLPPIAEGAQEHPRGLLLGTVDGLTFEYRVDDVRLLGVRAGELVERRDWAGRGGDPLRPLGKVVHLVEGGNPRPAFHHANQSLTAKLRGTWIEGQRVGLKYSLRKDGKHFAHVVEEVDAVGTSVAAGFRRSFRLSGGDNPGRSVGGFSIALTTLKAPHETVVGDVHMDAGLSAVTVKRADGSVELYVGRSTFFDDGEHGEPETKIVVRSVADGSKRVFLEGQLDHDYAVSIAVLSSSQPELVNMQQILSEIDQ